MERKKELMRRETNLLQWFQRLLKELEYMGNLHCRVPKHCHMHLISPALLGIAPNPQKLIISKFLLQLYP